MKQGEFPDDVRNFVIASIPSVSFLEALLQLRKGGEREWDSCRLAKMLYVSEAAAARLLTRLQADGFAQAAGGGACYRYRPCSEAVDHMVARLADAYSRHLVEISQLIHAKGGGSG
ncbi:MAG TPA: hypothetical protein VJ652_14015 [Noviherbaspirillum sp.]|nr:hypothetical protein [Noviherbaspirillum sp.]